MNIGIIGPGGIADDQHAPALSIMENVQLWSVHGRNTENAAKFAARHNARAPQPVFNEPEEMLADPELDAVIIATPDRFHAEHSILAMEAGKHVLVEKPMATSPAEALEMIEVARREKRCLAVAYHLRWHAGHRALRSRVLEGKLGTLRHMRVHWTFKAPDGSNWRSRPETGQWWSLAANGTHSLDLVRWMMSPGCGEIAHVHIHSSRSVWDTPHDETAVIVLEFESGATAEICSSVLFDSPSRVEVYGSEGFAECVGTLGRHGAGTVQIAGSPVNFEIANPFVAEIRDFVQAIERSGIPEVDGQAGLANIEILMSALGIAETV